MRLPFLLFLQHQRACYLVDGCIRIIKSSQQSTLNHSVFRPARQQSTVNNSGMSAVRESMAECPLSSLLQNRACDFHRTRLLNDVILVMDTVRSHHEMIYTA